MLRSLQRWDGGNSSGHLSATDDQLSSKTKAAGSDLVIVQLLQKHCSGQRPRPPGPITKKAPAACVGTLSSPCRDQCAVLPGPRTRSCCLSNLTLSFCLSTKSCFVKKYGYLATLRPQMLLHVLFPAVHMTVNQDLMDRLWQVYVRKCGRRVPDVPYCIVHTVARKGLVADQTVHHDAQAASYLLLPIVPIKAR